MRSDGGVATPDSARANPAHTLLSGPAGGVVAAAALARSVGIGDAISFDMGGTSADFSAIVGGEARMVGDRRVAGQPLRLPTLDVETISAGGGSIAWVDLGGALRVGPHSAGAVPGPACYPDGGSEPTVTDAAVLMGLLDPAEYLGGRIALDREKAAEALERRVAGPLGLTVEQAASGVMRVATAGMAQAIRTLCVERGVDPRRFWLVAFGGAGPLFSTFLARALEMRGVLVPANPGVFAAEGLLMSDIRHSLQAPASGRLSDPEAAAAFIAAQARLGVDADALLAGDGIAPASRGVRTFAGLRYVGQFHELEVPLAPDLLAAWDAEAVARAFHARHEAVYGHADAGAPIEFVSLKVDALGRIDRPEALAGGMEGRLAGPPTDDGAPPPAVEPIADRGTERPILLDDAEGFVSARVLSRESLSSGARIGGPAVVTQFDSTVIIAPGQVATVLPAGLAAGALTIEDEA